MPDSGFVTVFLIGLLGGVHCVGMCGGIVSALAAPLPGARVGWRVHLGYNLGRISSYTLAGALMGALSNLGLLLNGVLPVQMVLYVAANLMLIALGFYLIGFTGGLAVTERLGQRLWRCIQPLTAHFLPARTALQAYPLGLVWGWIPCGLVYSVLATALLTGSALRGAATMLVFGLGTLPNLLLAGMLLLRFRKVVQRRAVRLAAGSLVLTFGVVGLFNASTLGGRLWQGIVCHT